jgi:hypothetical protein
VQTTFVLLTESSSDSELTDPASCLGGHSVGALNHSARLTSDTRSAFVVRSELAEAIKLLIIAERRVGVSCRLGRVGVPPAGSFGVPSQFGLSSAKESGSADCARSDLADDASRAKAESNLTHKHSTNYTPFTTPPISDHSAQLN